MPVKDLINLYESPSSSRRDDRPRLHSQAPNAAAADAQRPIAATRSPSTQGSVAATSSTATLLPRPARFITRHGAGQEEVEETSPLVSSRTTTAVGGSSGASSKVRYGEREGHDELDIAEARDTFEPGGANSHQVRPGLPARPRNAARRPSAIHFAPTTTTNPTPSSRQEKGDSSLPAPPDSPESQRRHTYPPEDRRLELLRPKYTSTHTATTWSSTRSHIPVPATTVFARGAAPLHLPKLDEYLASLPRPEFRFIQQYETTSRIDDGSVPPATPLNELDAGGEFSGKQEKGSASDPFADPQESESMEMKPLAQPKSKQSTPRKPLFKCKDSARPGMFPPMDRLAKSGMSLDDLEENQKAIPTWRNRKSILGSSINVIIGFLGSSALASFYSLQGLVNTVQVFALILSTIVGKDGVTNKWRQLFLGTIPNVLALNFASTLTQSLLYLAVFIFLTSLLLYYFYRSTLHCDRYNRIEGLQQTETRGNQWGLVIVTFLLTVIYLPLSTMAIHVIVWSEELWAVGNPYRNATVERNEQGRPILEALGPVEEWRDPLDFCWTTTMKRNEVNYAAVIIILAVVAILFMTIWFPLALRRVIRESVPKVEKYNGLGRLRSAADMDAEYHRLLDRDRNPFAFLYSGFRRGWATYESVYLLAKLSTLLLIAIVDPNNCLFRHSSRTAIPIIRQVLLLVATIGFFIGQCVLTPFLDPVNNASEFTSRLNYLTTATTALAITLDVPGKKIVETYVLYSIYIVTYGLSFYFSAINWNITQRMVKRLTRRIDFSIDIFSPRLDVSSSSAHIRRRIWQESISTLLFTDDECRIPRDQAMAFAQARDSEFPPYLLEFQGTPAERHAENMKILREVGDMSYKKAVMLLHGPDYAWYQYLEQEIQRNYIGPDSYWKRPPREGEEESICKSYFGNAWWIPFPPTLVIRYDEGPLAVLKDISDLEAYIAQNSDPDIQRRRRVRMSLRALDGQKVFWLYEHRQRVGRTASWLSSRRSYEAATTVNYDTAVLRIKKRGYLRWEGVDLGSGFDVELIYAKNVRVPGDVIGLNDEFDLTSPLAKFLEVNRRLIEGRTQYIENVLRDYRRFHRKECKWKNHVLSYRFLDHVYAQPRDPTGLPQSSIEGERDTRIRRLMLGSGDTFRSMYERYSTVARSEAATWWYIFWDDLWRRNHDTIGGLEKHEADFNPHYATSIAYTPLPRPALESFLAQRGLLHKKPKLFDCIHAGFLNKLYLRLNECVFRDSNRAIMFHLGYNRNEFDMEDVDVLTQGNPSTLGTGGGTNHDGSWIRTRPTYRWEGLLTDPVRKKEYWGKRKWFAKLGAWFGLTPLWRSGAPSKGLSLDVKLENGRSNITEAGSASTATFVTALVFNAIVFGAQLGVFTLLRPRFKAIYEPRTYIGHGKHIEPLTPKPKSIAPRDKQSARAFVSTLFWPIALLNADFRQIIKQNGLDAYFFVRFLRMMIKIFVPIWLLSWPILLPITSVNTGVAENENDGLNKFTFGNVAQDQQQRYWAHLVCVWVFTFYILYVLRKEMTHFLITRQQHLTEKSHSDSVQARTVLITGVPDRYLTQKALRALFNDLPGGVQKIWINRNLKELPDIYDRRLAACNKLEKAEVDLMRTALKIKLAESKAAGKNKLTKADPRPSVDSDDSGKRPIRASEEGGESIEDVIVPRDKRPMHKTGFLGLFGPKVDTIDWCREEIATCTKLLEEGRSEIAASESTDAGDFTLLGHDDLQSGALDANGNPISRKHANTWKDVDGDGEGDVFNVKGVLVDGVKGAVGNVKNVGGDIAKGAVGGVKGAVSTMKGAIVGADGKEKYPPLNSAFVTFNRQIAAHLAVQALGHHMPYTMSDRYIEVAPSDVIYANLNLNPYEQKIRLAISYAATAGLIILWAFPVAFVGVISNISNVCSEVSWLAWICRLPDVVVGIIEGILPPILLAVLMMLLPIVLRLLARFEGIPKYTGLELSLMTRFFIFQVLHSFLIVTLSSGILASLEQLLNNPTSIPAILAQGLPKASTFFLTYMVLQGLSGTAGGFLQIVKLIIYYVKLILLGSTPRSIYNIKFNPGDVAWGTLFPNTTLLAVIGLAYSIISPIINGLAVLAFFLFYMLYKYLFLYVLAQDQRRDTGGLFFPKAIQHVFVGLYLQHICLAALFFLARNSEEKASSIPQGALMIVLIVFTAGFHAILNQSYGPLIVALPLSLKDRIGKGVSVEEAKTDVDAVKPGDATKQEAEIQAKAAERAAEGEVGPSHAEAGVISEERRLDGADSAMYPRTNNGSGDSNASEGAKADKAIASKMGDKEEDELERYGFSHPAASRPQRTVWIPHFTPRVLNKKTGETEVDEIVKELRGISEREMKRCVEAGVDTREKGARMDGKGKVEIAGPPPGYAGLV